MEILPTWVSRDLPILRAVALAEQEGEPIWSGWRERLPEDVRGLGDRELRVGASALIDAGYVEGRVQGGGGSPVLQVAITGLAERGRRAVGQWPSEKQLALEILDAIEAGAATALSPESRARWGAASRGGPGGWLGSSGNRGRRGAHAVRRDGRMTSRPDESLEDLIAYMGREAYDWDEGERVFRARGAVPTADGPLPLTVREALEAYDPDRYLDRSDEPREPRLPPIRWPPWAW